MSDELEDCKAELQTLKKLNNAFIECFDTLYKAGEKDTTVKTLLSIVGKFHNSDRAFVFETDETYEYVNNTYEWCAENSVSRIEDFQNIPVSVFGIWIDKLQQESEIFLGDIKSSIPNDSLIYEVFFAYGKTDSVLIMPLKPGNCFCGFVGVGNPKAFTDNTILLKTVATSVMNEIQRESITKELIHYSFYDKLTGLRNRHAFIEHIKMLEGQAKPLGIIYADLNGLKSANDKYGHEAGDKMIVEASSLLKEFFNEAVYRIGGDEFVALCEGISRDAFNEKIQELSKQWHSEFTISCGSIWLPLCEDIEYYISIADNRMYENKKAFYGAKKTSC